MFKSFILFLILFSFSLNADFLRVESGIGIWSSDNSGKSTYTNNSTTGTDTVIKETFYQGYVWFNFKHPIPYIPNLKLNYNSVEYNGLISGSFKNFTIPSSHLSNSNLIMDQYDIIPYYNLLDNTFWITLNIGLNIKVIDSFYTAEQITVGGLTIFEGYKDNSTTVVPLGYLNSRINIPTTNFGIEADLKYISYNNNSIIDSYFKVDYSFNNFTQLKPGLELGYKYQNFDLNDNEGTKIDLTFSGLFLGFTAKF